MYKKSLFHPILFGLITIILAASCDKDFNELGTNIVGDDHFGFQKFTGSTIKAYNQKLNEIASNNLPINPLGFYDNPAFGTTQADFVTQVQLAAFNITFNNTTPGDYDATDLVNHGPTVLDSVVMEIPYFKTLLPSSVSNVNTYRLDSIYGAKPFDITTPAIVDSKFSLKVYQSNYFLRDLDPAQSLVQQQLYYTGQSQETLISGSTVGTPLNNLLTTDPLNTDGHENDSFYFDKREHKTITYATGSTTPVPTRSVPSMRLHLDKTVFSNLILMASPDKLADNTTFTNYFRGLYFQVSGGNPGNMAMLNFAGGKITLYYNEDVKTTPTTGAPTYARTNKTFVLNLTGNSISLQHTTDNANYTAAANSTQEASKLYVKGGEGSMAIIDLFGTTDTKGYVLNPNYNANLPISTSNPKYTLTGPNGISDEIDDMKFNGWLINEANLTFNIDTNAMSDVTTIEPNRIYLYSITHKEALVDYSYDLSTNSAYPKFNKSVYGGFLADANGALVIQKVNNVITKKGNKYKIRITNFVRNLIEKDSANVRLGLSVTESISNTGLSKLKTPNANVDRAPTMSVMSPLGTILYGTNIPPTDSNYASRLQLEIWYTKP